MEGLKKTGSFKKVYNHRRSMANRLLVLYIMKNGKPVNRIGISISRKVGNAVVRNRIKRVIKEHFEAYNADLKKGYDMVIVVRAEAGTIKRGEDFKKIGSALQNLFSRQRIG